MKIKSIITLAILIAIFGYANAQSTSFESRLSSLDEYFDSARINWEVPGMAIGIVSNDSLIFAKGYGVLEIGKNDKVDPNSIFAIASNTKAFTATALLMLAEEGKVNLDDKVKKYLPYFELYDPYVTENMTVRDLLCHRSGLETFSGDLVWYGTSYSREEVVKRAKFLEPKYPFRTDYGYQNIMFIAAGEIVSKVSGMSYDEFLKERIFNPLGMNRSITSVDDFKGFDNIAKPHTIENDEVITIPYTNWDNIGGAGVINSCVNDVSKWIRLQLNRGQFEGERIFSKESSHEMWQSHTINSVSEGVMSVWPTTHFKNYALGWSVRDYQGRKIVSHSGGYDGVITFTCMIPEENMGFVILTNKNSSLYYALQFSILDAILAPEETTDWSSRFLSRIKANEEYEKKKQVDFEDTRIKKTKPSFKLKEYTGTYSSELYGDVEVRLEDGELMVFFIPTSMFVGKLTHWHYDSFRIKLINTPSLPEGMVQFIPDVNGNPEEMRIDIPNPDFYFTELKLLKKKEQKLY